MGTCERGQKSKAHGVLGASSIDADFRLHCGGFQDPTHVPQILEMAGLVLILFPSVLKFYSALLKP